MYAVYWAPSYKIGLKLPNIKILSCEHQLSQLINKNVLQATLRK